MPVFATKLEKVQNITAVTYPLSDFEISIERCRLQVSRRLQRTNSCPTPDTQGLLRRKRYHEGHDLPTSNRIMRAPLSPRSAPLAPAIYLVHSNFPSVPLFLDSRAIIFTFPPSTQHAHRTLRDLIIPSIQANKRNSRARPPDPISNRRISRLSGPAA